MSRDSAAPRWPGLVFHRSLLSFAVLALLAVLNIAAVAEQLSPAALDQIRALSEEKSARTPQQRKLDSHLVFAIKMRRGEPIARGIATLPGALGHLRINTKGKVLVDVRADVTPALLAGLERLDGRVIAAFPDYREVRALVPLLRLEEAADLPGVQLIEPAAEAVTNVITSAGDHAHAADLARLAGSDGTGIKVGVLSDGVNSLAAQQGAGELPAVTVLTSQAGSGDEGTAMLEIVHDLAPGAQLYFATAFNGVASMASNILALRAAGCQIIVDDVTYFNEGAFEDGPIANAVTSVTGGGALYFSSAANSGSKDKGTSGTWEGDFLNSGTTIPGAGILHDFGGGNISDLITSTAGPVSLKWSDPLGASGNDYDLYIYNSTLSTVLDASTNVQSGTQDPYEIVSNANTQAGNRVVVFLFSGSARALRVDTNRGRLAINTAGSTFGHNAAASAITVAAVAASTAGGGRFTGGAGNPVETFSSDGPRRLFYFSNGAAITPGNVLFGTNGGGLLAKPDLTAADGVATGVGGFNPFFGTSAAAPHAAAIAALAMSLPTHPSAAEVRTALAGSALDNEAVGFDRDSGAGIIMAPRALGVISRDLYTLAPCRAVDTRNPAGPQGGPTLAPSATRQFALTGVCGVPLSARAVSVNVTVLNQTATGNLRLFPSDVAAPTVSTINFVAGLARANNALLPLSVDGQAGFIVQNGSTGTVDFILDINGYFK